MNREAQVRKAARTLVREFKADKDANAIRIDDAFTMVITNKRSGWYFRRGDSKAEIYFGDLGDEAYAKLTCEIAQAVKGMLKLPKRTLVFMDERRHSRLVGWTSVHYTSVNRIVILTPCREFGAVNKKLVRLGLKPIPFAEWYHGAVFGKRADYDMEELIYNAANAERCKAVLDYLKGKKKLAYEIVREEHFHDRERGIEYETEWSGHLYFRLRFTDAKGTKATF